SAWICYLFSSSLHDALPIYDREEAHAHEYGGAGEGGAPGHGAEQAAQQRADGQTDPERGLVEDDRARAGPGGGTDDRRQGGRDQDRKSTRLNSSHVSISYAV